MSHFISYCSNTRPQMSACRCRILLAVIIAASFLLGLPASIASDEDNISRYTSARTRPAQTKHTRANRIVLTKGSYLDLLGEFSSDTKFRRPPMWNRFAQPDNHNLADTSKQAAVPPGMLHSYERAVASYAPPHHAMVGFRAQPLPQSALSALATLAYGHARTLQFPDNVTTDSRQRVIISDPAVPAVHVIDPQHKESFRIVGGPESRLTSPGDIAVDAEDNIYIVDARRAVILIFSPHGEFRRQIGLFRGESMYQYITGIAIDRSAGHLYLAEGPQHMVFMLDLEGNVLRRVGKYSSRNSPGELQRRENYGPELFDYPQDIAVADHEIAVLDKNGTRVHVLDLDCRPIRNFSVQHAAKDHATHIGTDRASRIYLSYSDDSEVRLFSSEGKLLGSFGHDSLKLNQLQTPAGLWIDATNRIYVVDSEKALVQLYALK